VSVYALFFTALSGRAGYLPLSVQAYECSVAAAAGCVFDKESHLASIGACLLLTHMHAYVLMAMRASVADVLTNHVGALAVAIILRSVHLRTNLIETVGRSATVPRAPP
jgi:hypothetical protein